MQCDAMQCKRSSGEGSGEKKCSACNSTHTCVCVCVCSHSKHYMKCSVTCLRNAIQYKTLKQKNRKENGEENLAGIFFIWDMGKLGKEKEELTEN